jgi:uncharacterized YccA/Bax inhibitor family protein
MALMRTSNPALNKDAFQVPQAGFGETMTLSGTVNKTGILLICAVLTAAWSWNRFVVAPESAMPLLAIGGIGGLIVAMVTIFKKEWSPVTAPLYALLEGLVLGSISAMYEARFHGIATEAVGLTFGTLFVLLLAYHSGLIRATERFKLGVVAATGGIMIFYVAEMVLGFFGVHLLPAVNGAGPIGIGFSVFVVIIASLNLVLDFDFIENGAAQGAPKYMEWYGAFGLMVTLVWLYLEMLRLLAKLNSRQ